MKRKCFLDINGQKRWFNRDLCLKICNYVIDNDASENDAAKEFNLYSSQIHRHLTEYIKCIDPEKYETIQEIIKHHKMVGPIKGGSKTKLKNRNFVIIRIKITPYENTRSNVLSSPVIYIEKEYDHNYFKGHPFDENQKILAMTNIIRKAITNNSELHINKSTWQAVGNVIENDKTTYVNTFIFTVSHYFCLDQIK